VISALSCAERRAKIGVASLAGSGDGRTRGRVDVPLSEDEQRILQEIEQQLYASDPELAHEVGSTTIYRHAGRNLKWAALGFVVGVAFMVLMLSVSFWLAFAGFLVMLACAIVFEENLRKMGRAGWQQWTESMRAAGVRDYFGSAGKRVRERFKRDE
jgi:Protein of unknown function (DUF3040)